MMALAIFPPPIKAMCGTGASWVAVKEAWLREAVIYLWREKEDGHSRRKNRKRQKLSRSGGAPIGFVAIV